MPARHRSGGAGRAHETCGERRGRLLADAQHAVETAQLQGAGDGPVRRSGEVQPIHVFSGAAVRIQERLEADRAEEVHGGEVDDDVVVLPDAPRHLPVQRRGAEQVDIAGEPQEHDIGVSDLHVDPQGVSGADHGSDPGSAGALPDCAVGRRCEEQHDPYDGEPE